MVKTKWMVSDRPVTWITALLLMLFSALAEAQAGDSSPLEGSAPVRNIIEAVAVMQQVGQILIRVSTNIPFAGPPTSFTMANPPRIAFDFPNTVTRRGNAHLDMGEGDLWLIAIVQVSDRTRMVLTLRNILQHDAKVDGKDLLITLTPTGHASN